MLGITPFGLLHSAISLVPLGSGAWALIRHRQFSMATASGRTYLLSTALTAATGLGLFPHGGFGGAHLLSLITLVLLAVGFDAERNRRFGAASNYVQLIAYTATLLLNLLPAATELGTRLPIGAPLIASREDPAFYFIYRGLIGFVVVLLIAQLRWLRTRSRPLPDKP